MSRRTRGGGTLLQSLHLLTKGMRRLILKMKAIGDLRDERLKPASVLSLTRLVALRKSVRCLFFQVVVSSASITEADSYYAFQIKEPLRRASELREKLLKEKIKKMRTSSLDSVEGKANSQ